MKAEKLIEALTEALTKLITTGTSTMVVLGILVILAVVVLRATPEVQRQVLPPLISMLSVIVGQMLASQKAPPPKPPETPSPSG